MSELKRAQIKCHGNFKKSLSISGDKVSINFTADRRSVDLNKLGGDAQGWCNSYLCK